MNEEEKLNFVAGVIETATREFNKVGGAVCSAIDDSVVSIAEAIHDLANCQDKMAIGTLQGLDRIADGLFAIAAALQHLQKPVYRE